MSDCYSSNDQNWPDNGSSRPLIIGPFRPALTRVWHGMLLMTQSYLKTNQVGAYFWDPYASVYGGLGFLSLLPIPLGQSVAAATFFYADLVTWMFYSDGTNFLCASAPQPPLDPQTNQIQFTSITFGSPSIVATNTTANDPSAFLYNGSVYVCWASSPAHQGDIVSVSYASAPYTPGSALVFGPVSTLPVSPIAAPSFAVWQGKIYCAYWTNVNFIQVVAFVPYGLGLMMESVPTQYAGCGPLQCNFAPSLATDPKGTFLMMVFCQPSSNQLCTTYLVADPGSQSGTTSWWSDPQLIKGQATSVSPTVIATGGNYAYLSYLRTDGQGTNLVTSDALPSVIG